VIAGPVLEVLALLQEEGITPTTLRSFAVRTGTPDARVLVMVGCLPRDLAADLVGILFAAALCAAILGLAPHIDRLLITGSF